MNNQNQNKPKATNKIETMLTDMPARGARLPGGLALRLTTANGFTVLGCSRIDVAPSETEMVVLKTGVIKVFDPRWLFESDRADLINDTNGQAHYIRRLYWPLEEIKLVHGEYEQAALIGDGEPADA